MINKNTCPRVFYFGMINTAKYAELCDENLHVGAGSSKMLSVIRALRSVGVKGWIISLPVLGAASRINFKKKL